MTTQAATGDPKLTQEQATQALADILKQKRELQQQQEELLEAAKLIANEYGLTFQWSEEHGAAHQEYIGKGAAADDWYHSSDYDRDDQGGFWVSSSMGC